MGSAILLLLLLGAGWLVVRNSNDSDDSDVDPAAPAVISPGDTVWLLGDSLGVGLRKHLVRLATDHGCMLEATAKVGAPTRWGAKLAHAQAKSFDVWLVVLGANDGGTRPDALRSAVRAIRMAADASGARLVWLLPPNGGGLPRYDQVFSIVAAEAGDFVLPPKEVEFAPDGIHLTSTGYAQWARHVWDSLAR